MSFTHLHVHTEYSLLDGSNKIKEYVARVKELGMNSGHHRSRCHVSAVLTSYIETRVAGNQSYTGM